MDDKHLVKGNFCLDFPSVGATETLMMAAALADGKTVLSNVAQEPEVVDLADVLISCGASIHGAGTNTLSIVGTRKLHGMAAEGTTCIEGVRRLYRHGSCCFFLHEGMREEKVRCVGHGASGGENRGGGGGVGRGGSGPEPGGRGGGRLAAVQGFEEAPEKDNAISLTELCQVKGYGSCCEQSPTISSFGRAY